MSGSIQDDIRSRIINSGNSLLHIIAINVAAFLLMAVPMGIASVWVPFKDLYDGFADWMFLPGSPATLLTRPWTLITHFFLHSFGIRHILFNMLFLWWFGKVFHDLMGNKKTIQLYVLSGIIGGLAFMVATHIIPNLTPADRLVGASGAVTAFVVAAATLSPHYTIRLFFFGNIKLWYIAAFFIISDLIFFAENTGGITAHLAGGATGYLYVTQIRKHGRNIGAWVTNVLDFFAQAFSRKPKSNLRAHANTSRRSTSSSRNGDSPTQADVDAILEKIHRSGYDSLSDREKKLLFRESNKE